MEGNKDRNRLDGNYLPAIAKTHRIREILDLIKKLTNVLSLKKKTHFNYDQQIATFVLKEGAQFKTETQ